MKKHLALAGILAAAAVSAHADLIKVAVNGGYTTISMTESNDRSDKAKKAIEGAGGTASFTPLSSGWFVAAEAGIGMLPFLEVGPRLEFLQSNQSVFTTEGPSILNPKSVTTTDATLSSFMLGANVGMDLPLTGLGFGVGAYGGYGYAVAKSSSTWAGQPSGGALYAGGGLVGELEAKLTYKIIPLLSAELLAGIRMANVGKLKDGSAETVDPVDFSGFNAGAGISLGF